jgi:hypothetical protein
MHRFALLRCIRQNTLYSYTASIVTGLQAGRAGGGGGSIPGGSKSFISSPKRPDRIRRPPSLLFSGYRRFILGVKRPGHKLTTYLHIVPRLRMSGAIPLLPYMPSWHGQGQLYPYHFTAVAPLLTLWPDSAGRRWIGGSSVIYSGQHCINSRGYLVPSCVRK